MVCLSKWLANEMSFLSNQESKSSFVNWYSIPKNYAITLFMNLKDSILSNAPIFLKSNSYQTFSIILSNFSLLAWLILWFKFFCIPFIILTLPTVDGIHLKHSNMTYSWLKSLFLSPFKSESTYYRTCSRWKANSHSWKTVSINLNNCL